MASTKLRVAVAGPNGTLGQFIIKNLLLADFSVTALTRDPSKCTDSFPKEVKLVKADYSAIETLEPLLKGQDAVVDLINRNHPDTSIRLIDAAIAAKVLHFIPSSFGMDQSNEYLRTLPVMFSKVKMEDYVFARAKEGSISCTAIETCMFFDWALSMGILIPPGGGPTRIFGRGDVKLSVSLRDDIGKAVATALLKREMPEVRNKRLFMRSTGFTQQQIIQYAREANPNKSWEPVSIDVDALLKMTWEKYNQGDTSVENMRGFLVGGSYGRGLGHFKYVDNDLLGIKEMSEQDLKDMIAKFVA